jgi:5-methylcytosine-specific restriction endonuclease McrA
VGLLRADRARGVRTVEEGAVKRGAPLKRTGFKRKEGPSSSRPEHPQAKAPGKRSTLTAAPARCKHCREKFTAEERAKALRLHSGCQAGFAEGFAAKLQKDRERAERAKAKAERSQDRAKLEEFKSVPKLIAAAQRDFNAYIRARDKDKTCFVCDRPFVQSIKGRALQAGHVRSRGAAGHLRFVEDNCHGECEGCNGPNGAKPHQIEAGAIRRIGQERYDALKNNNAPHKWTKDELRATAAHFRAKRRELEKNKA